MLFFFFLTNKGAKPTGVQWPAHSKSVGAEGGRNRLVKFRCAVYSPWRALCWPHLLLTEAESPGETPGNQYF